MSRVVKKITVFVLGGIDTPQKLRVYDPTLGWMGGISLVNFSSNIVQAISYSSSLQVWFIGGIGPRLNSYDLTNTYDETPNLVSMAYQINAIEWSGNYCLIGGEAGGLNKY